ncbi:retropepsin-like aspartic protease family protein [Microbulbifer yueqingensis]|uniref:Aspartyl protease family protein n=1 Tax=Microbulbifer yueqingensis TaxID=658219 RepID=A0A1G8XY97_9GAMM|nr:TIGR02281 family clan AA aspartic protease [Microbulbifer yueqingensis]SDJ95513.1 aspartyl protease family protein [Microbulbifer yueqingensis]
MMIHRLLFCCLVLVPAPLWAQQVQLKALFGSSAMLEVDGRQRLLKSGQTSPEGVRLLEANSKFARVKVGERVQKLTLDAPVAARYARAEQTEVRLVADSRGHFSTDAWVNGRRVPVLVDTGATSIAFNYPTAKGLGLDLDGAEPISVATANGVTRAYRVTLASVTVGGIKLHNIEATVHANEFPHITLLGNSFLSRVDMEQQRGMLILRARN